MEDICTCSSTTENVFSIGYFDSSDSSIVQYPLESEDELTITNVCEESKLTFSVGDGNIDYLYAREIIAENDYRVLDLDLTGLGTAEVSLTVTEDLDGKLVEFTYFEAGESPYGTGAISSKQHEFVSINTYVNLVDDSCGCEEDYLKNDDTSVCIAISELSEPALTAT